MENGVLFKILAQHIVKFANLRQYTPGKGSRPNLRVVHVTTVRYNFRLFREVSFYLGRNGSCFVYGCNYRNTAINLCKTAPTKIHQMIMMVHISCQRRRRYLQIA